MRLSPIPNWFINLIAAHIPIRLFEFVSGTIVGLLPAMYVQVVTGMAAMKIIDEDNYSSFYSMIIPVVIILLLMWICSKYVSKHFIPQEITDVLKKHHHLSSIFNYIFRRNIVSFLNKNKNKSWYKHYIFFLI